MIPSQMASLMECVKQNKRLCALNISYNNMIAHDSGKDIIDIVKDNLFTLLRENKKLIHLDLTATNLSEAAIRHILPAIRKSKSLQGIHLSGNPGVTEDIKNEARQILKTVPNEVKPIINLANYFSDETKVRYHEQWLRESVKIKHITTGKSLVQNGSTEDKFIDH